MDIYIDAPLECGVVRHNLIMWMSNSSFLRGAGIQKFCFKKMKIGMGVISIQLPSDTGWEWYFSHGVDMLT